MNPDFSRCWPLQAVVSGLALPIALAWIVPVQAEELEQTQQLLNTNQCQQCDLSRAGLVYADLSGAALQEANLSQANLSRGNLSGADLSGANLSGASLVSVNLSNANLSGANLSGADLRGAILTGANLQEAVLDQANLLGVVGLPTEVATPETLYTLGLAEAERGNYRGAIAYYDQVLGTQPDFAAAYLARGIANFHMGDYATALQNGQQAEQLYLLQTNDRGYQAATQFNAGVQVFQDQLAEQNDVEGGNGFGTQFLGFLGSLAGLMLRFGLF